MFITHGKTRSRTLPGPTFQLREGDFDTNLKKWFYGSYAKYTGGGTQITESDGNQWPLPKEKTLSDHGSEFYTQKKEIVNSKFAHSTVNIKGGTNLPYALPGVIEGNLIANIFKVVDQGNFQGRPVLPLQIAWPDDNSSSRNALVVKGTAAIAACSPGNPIAHVATALGEFLQDVPAIPGVHLWEARLKALATLGAAGGEFLNLAFGISPTIGDMTDFLKAVHKYDKAIYQFQRDAGRVVRRGFRFDKEKSVTTDVLPHVYSPAVWSYNASTLQGGCETGAINRGYALPTYETVRTRTIEREVWFEGAFTYYLPRGYDPLDEGDRRRLLAEFFGAKPDLNTLWNLTPWSWAVDWFSSAGNTIKNLQNHINYGTVMRYGYVMEKTTVTDTYSAGAVKVLPLAGSGASNYRATFTPPYPVVSPVTLRVTTKKRIQANPFGFGLSWEGLSTFQQAIAAALGITRVVR